MGSDNIFQLNIEALYINIPFSDLYITHIDYISVEHSISTEVPPAKPQSGPVSYGRNLSRLTVSVSDLFLFSLAMSKSIKALSLKGKQDWDTSVFCFSRHARNNLLWEKDRATKEALKHFFQHHLTSTPRFRHSLSRVTIQMFYYVDQNAKDLDAVKLEPLESLIKSLYPNKIVDLRFTRLHYPYMNAEILAKYLTINAEHSGWGPLTRQFYKGVPMVKAPLSHNMPFSVQWNKLLPQVANGNLQTGIQGIKFTVSGRLGRRKGAGRSTILRKSLGTFQFTSHRSLVDVGRHTFFNRNGSITIKVWIATALFGVNAMAKQAGQKAASTAAKL